MQTYRTYGTPPYTVAVIHGGPGAAGEMAPVAKELSKTVSVIEPMQTVDSVEGQIEELANILRQKTQVPSCLVGHSWGAFLSALVAARYPHLVSKLLLVSSGPFVDTYAEIIMPERLKRLSPQEREEAHILMQKLNDKAHTVTDKEFARFGALMSKADSYCPLDDVPHSVACNAHIYQKVWPEFAALRSSGELLALAGRISCPVVAIHGLQDPSPFAGVHKPLSEVLSRYNGIVLDQCGHTPWREKYTKEAFFNIIREEVGSVLPS